MYKKNICNCDMKAADCTAKPTPYHSKTVQDAKTICDCGTIKTEFGCSSVMPVASTDNKMGFARAYIRPQVLDQYFCPMDSLACGTAFPELRLPYGQYHGQ